MIEERQVLHIGNILNNGYLHCRYLRKRGVSADCLNVDYKHCQGQPEWAEVYIDKPVNEFNPNWDNIDLRGFKRPGWFFDVNLTDIGNLVNTIKGETNSEAPRLREKQRPSTLEMLVKLNLATGCSISKVVRFSGGGFILDRLNKKIQKKINMDLIEKAGMPRGWVKELGERLMNDYAKAYPDRNSDLSMEDIYEWLSRGLAYSHILSKYKLVQAYSLDPIYVLLGNPGQPFICYEHGTMREFPFENSSRGRLYSLCLKRAEKVIITNADCKFSAEKLGLTNCVFIPHIIDDELFKPAESSLRAKLKQERGCDFIFLAPARHHWKNCPQGLENSWFKKNDILIRGLGRLFRQKPDLKALVIFFEWGQEVDLSKALIMECGFADKVLWEPIRSKPVLKEFYNAADIVLDQFNNQVGTFGAVVPEAFACAKPVILNFEKDLHYWCYPELPPVLNAAEEEAIEKAIIDLIRNESYRKNLGFSGRRWFEKYHSSKVVIDRMIDIYMCISEKYKWDWSF